MVWPQGCICRFSKAWLEEGELGAGDSLLEGEEGVGAGCGGSLVLEGGSEDDE